jgi:uncharacterized protein (TIGR02186 family)
MRQVGIILAALVLATAILPYAHSDLAVAQAPAKPKVKTAVAPPTTEVAPLPPERVEADVSSRTIAVTSGYSGSEILVFGTIENSRQPSAESGFYDVVVVVEGEPEPLMVRKKGRVGGLWVNTSTFSFNSVPSYYAVASTRPLEEFAEAAPLDEAGIGLDAVRMAPSAASAVRVSSEDLIAYKDAVLRLKQGAQLFKRDDYGVIFTGRSLFRATIAVPATVPVVPLTARVFLFHEGELLSRYQARVVLEREGIERWLYAFATDRPFLYGVVTVLIAIATGLLASALLRRRIS